MIQGSWNDFPQFIPLYLFRQNCGINKIIRYLKCVVLWFMYVLWRDYPHWANFSVTVMRHLYIHCKALKTVLWLLNIHLCLLIHLLFLIILSLWDYFPSVCRLLFHFLFSFCFYEFNSARNKFYQYWFVWKTLFHLSFRRIFSGNKIPFQYLGNHFVVFWFSSLKNLLSILLLFEGFVFIILIVFIILFLSVDLSSFTVVSLCVFLAYSFPRFGKTSELYGR